MVNQNIHQTNFVNNIKFLQNFKNLKIIVTGSTGFKGAWLCFWLNLLGAKVIGIGLQPEKGAKVLNKLLIEKKIKQYILDIRNIDYLDRVIKKEKPDAIIHLAAQSIVSYSFYNPLETFKTNIIGSANILQLTKKYKIKSLVYITSDKCYLNLNKGKPFKESDVLGGQDNYSASKASAEILFNAFHNSYFLNENKNLTAVTARAGNVIGGGDFKENRIVPDIIRAVESKRPLIIRNPKATRPWQHVLEPLKGYLLLTDKILNKKLKKSLVPNWNFGPQPTNAKKVIEVVRNILSYFNEEKKIIIKNNFIYESQLLSLNIKKAKKELNWEPSLNFLDTMSLTANWYKNYIEEKNLSKITQEQIEFYLSIK